MYGNILIYRIVNRLSMFMLISNIDFSYLTYIYIYIFGSCIYIYIFIYNLHERVSSSNKETLYFRPDAFRLLPSSGFFALRLITYD